MAMSLENRTDKACDAIVPRKLPAI
jgi:hypothetical protein